MVLLLIAALIGIMMFACLKVKQFAKFTTPLMEIIPKGVN